LYEYAGFADDFDYRLFTTFSYSRDRMSVALNWRYLPESLPAARVSNPEATNLSTDAYNMFNLNGSWSFSEKLRLRGGIDNVFDLEPPLTGRNPFHPTNPTNGTGTTDRSVYDALGRRYFLGVAVNF
jgi:outer membrane receptor for ferrienterochelin and colicin